jgi:hypothetical protein
MTDKSYLEEFTEGVSGGLSQKLVDILIEGHRDPSTKQVDIVTRLKEQMEQALHRDTDAAS